jgi:hypothetical protein
MALNSVYKKYFQKSKVFLYPILGIKRGVSVVPIETYISWKGYYNSEDMKLICVYDVRTDDEYKHFEKNVLLNHNRLNDYVKVDNQLVLTFDLSDLGDDWFHFINGKYSKISMNLKQKILNFFDKYSGNYAYMHSYLIPEKYFSNYAELLGVEPEMLIQVGELCTKPDMEKETLFLEPADLGDLSENKLLNLSKPTENE